MGFSPFLVSCFFFILFIPSIYLFFFEGEGVFLVIEFLFLNRYLSLSDCLISNFISLYGWINTSEHKPCISLLFHQGSALELLKRSSRLSHSVATPLLFSPLWRKKLVDGGGEQPKAKRHDSGASDSKSVSGLSKMCRWLIEKCRRLMKISRNWCRKKVL